ncbi:hypothetical protein [Solicola sp. PLA-1-18]|uniref:hypothetical protein n=1 Tax=Solicola sp. PLA-1-18 TaxID=3380532 RepID=UPI003B823273
MPSDAGLACVDVRRRDDEIRDTARMMIRQGKLEEFKRLAAWCAISSVDEDAGHPVVGEVVELGVAVLE